MQAAAQRMVEFWLGTFADPIYLGRWPASVAARIPFLPKISPELVRPFVAWQYKSPTDPPQGMEGPERFYGAPPSHTSAFPALPSASWTPKAARAGHAAIA